MTVSDPERIEQRVLVLTPTDRDAELAIPILARAGLLCLICSDLEHLRRQIDIGAGAVLLPEEFVLHDHEHGLSDWLRRQPPWSDLPVLVLARPGADSETVARAMDQLGNVTVLERPTRVASLVSAIRTALRARQRQYQIRDYLRERELSEERLREADRRKDEFLAILAHELRNPLAPIRNSLHILRLTTRDDPAAERVGEMMERQVNHMVRLVDDLMEVSRITRGTIELRTERVEMARVVDNAVETSRPLIDAARHELIVALPPESLIVDADPVRLAQVFANLLNNAAKYTNPGGKIWLTAERDGQHAVVSVRDTGTGISAHMLPRVFDPFTQVDLNPGYVQGGLGIGLTLAKRLAEMHGATVEARSEGLGMGSEFVVRLPLANGLGPMWIKKSGPPRALLTQRRILVVDDNRDAAISLGMLLGLLGADVHIEYSGAAALEAVATYKPTVVLLDISMPDMDGYEVANRIRRQPELRDLTLIALSGRGQEEDRRLSSLAGFDFHLIKPTDIDALESLLVSIEHRGHDRTVKD